MYTHVCVYIYIYIHMCVCIYLYIYIYVMCAYDASERSTSNSGTCSATRASPAPRILRNRYG